MPPGARLKTTPWFAGLPLRGCTVEIPFSVIEQSGKGRRAVASSGEGVEHRFGAVGLQPVNSAATLKTKRPRAALVGGAIEVAGRVPYQRRFGNRPIRAVHLRTEPVQHGFAAALAYLEEHATAAHAAQDRCSVQIARLIFYEPAEGIAPVIAALEAVENSLLSVRREFVDRAAAESVATRSPPVWVAPYRFPD